MEGYCSNIERTTLGNADFRRVIYTGKHTQLLLHSNKHYSTSYRAKLHAKIQQLFSIQLFDATTEKKSWLRLRRWLETVSA